MQKTRLSLYYLASYLLVGGVGLLLVPELALKLLFSSGDYGTAMPRTVGMFMVGMGAIIVQVIRHEATFLYPTTLAVRAFFLLTFLALYFSTGDPLFITLLFIVALGFVLTGYFYHSEKNAST